MLVSHRHPLKKGMQEQPDDNARRDFLVFMQVHVAVLRPFAEGFYHDLEQQPRQHKQPDTVAMAFINAWEDFQNRNSQEICPAESQ